MVREAEAIVMYRGIDVDGVWRELQRGVVEVRKNSVPA
jgi:hypothetical protein